jgi:fucose 4-O-acetylase-like acetyltransferase
MKNEINQESVSKSAFLLKAMAIFCVICAHCPYDTQSFLSCILNNLGVIGVPIFFFVAGFFYHAKKYSAKDLLTKKLKTLLLPWIICGLIVYLYVALRKGGDILAMINFVIGNGSYLYYMTILFLFYILFFFIKDNKWGILSMAIVSLLWMTAQGVYNPLLEIIYPYLNPLNWLLYFALGVYFQYYFKAEKALDFVERYKWVFIGVGLIAFIIPNVLQYKFTYWKLLFPVFEIACFMGMLALSTVKWMQNKVFLDIGKNSFSIYLLHMPIVGITNLVLIHYLVYCIRPFFVLAVIYACVVVYVFICRKLKCDWLKNLIGAR